MKANINEGDFLEYYKSALPPKEDEEVPEVSRPKNSSPFWVIVFLLVGLFAGLAALGYILFGSSGASAKVAVSIDGPTELTSGSEVLYTISISNKESTPLTDTSLLTTFPEGFEFIYASEDPKNSKKNYWSLGELGGFQNKVITVRGRLSGIKNESKELLLSFQYHQKGVSAEFGSSARFQTKMSSSALAVQLSGPAQLTEGEKGTYTITYDTFESYAQKDSVELRVTPPEGFKATDLLPKSDHDMIWSAHTLLKAIDPSKKTGTIIIRGSFGDAAPGVKGFSATIGRKAGEIFSSEQTTSLDTTLTGSDFKARLLINGKNDPTPLSLNAPITVTIPIENTGTAQLTGLSASLSLNSPILDWSKIENPHNGIIKDSTITWSEREVPQLKLLKPGEKTGLLLTLNLKSAEQIRSLPDEVKSLDPFSLTSTVTVSGSKLDAPFTTEPITLAQLINGDTRITSLVQYYGSDGSTLGSGPLPPKVGEQTKYHASWVVTNTMHELADIKLTAHLPKNVTWMDTSTLDAGTITFNPKNNTVTWTLNRMPKTVTTLKVQFDVALVPTSKNIGAVLPLVEKISFSATDKATNGLIKLSVIVETTELSDDTTAQGKGVVVK